MESIVLKKNIFSEGNEIIVLYTRELGKVRAVAKSVKSAKSKLAFGLQSLFHSDIEMLPSKNLFSIIGVKPINAFPALREDLSCVYPALYATELLLKSTADEQPNQALFDSYLDFLKHLNSKGGESSEVHACVDFFALQVLALNGYALEFSVCSFCKRSLPDSENKTHFSKRKGGFLCSVCADNNSDSIQISQRLFKILQEHAYQNPETQDKIVSSSSGELHSFAQDFVTYILERNLNTTRYLV